MAPDKQEFNQRVRRALEHVKNSTTDSYPEMRRFEADSFIDPDIAKLERDRIFGAVPTIVCHSSEIARANDFVTLQMPRNNLIVVRQKDGSVKSFVNACRHRGAMVEAKAAGRARLFSCPYHRWSYDTNGDLREITRANTFGEVDRAKQGLIEIPTEERHGFVWVVDRFGADINVAEWLGPEFDAILADFQIDNLINYKSEQYEYKINWKISQDAFLDAYHIQYAHPNTAAKHVHTNAIAVEDFGSHARSTTPRKSIDRWLEEDPGDEDLTPYVTEAYFLGPNSTLLRQPDHFELLTFRPDRNDPQTSIMEMRLLVPKFEDMDVTQERYDRLWTKNWQILIDVIQSEDIPLLQGAQISLQSDDAGSMVLGHNEHVNHIFHREVARLLSIKPSDPEFGKPAAAPQPADSTGA